MSLLHGWIRFENHQIHWSLINSLLYFQELKLQKVQELTKLLTILGQNHLIFHSNLTKRALEPTKLYKVT